MHSTMPGAMPPPCPAYLTQAECLELQAIAGAAPPSPEAEATAGWLMLAVILGFLAFHLWPWAE